MNLEIHQMATGMLANPNHLYHENNACKTALLATKGEYMAFEIFC